MQDEITELRLYSPLTADLFEPDNGDWEDEGYDPDETIELDGYELAPYEEVILEGIADEALPDEDARGLMVYFHGSPSVDEKVVSLHPSVETVGGRLYGVAVCQIKGELSPEELEELKEYASGQYSDGWGEGAEQRPRQTSNGELYFHFWQSRGFYIRTAQEMGFEPPAPALKQELSAPVQHVDKDTFWTLMDNAKTLCGQDLTASANWLREQLRTLGPEESIRFHAIMHCYSDAANCYSLWNAATVIKGWGCSDDSFIDFRAWLIAQGREVYTAALKDPDSLAAVEPYANCAFESLCYVGDMAYEQMTGKSAYDAALPESLKQELKEIGQSIAYGPGPDRPLEWEEMVVSLPHLCKKHMAPDTLRFHAWPKSVWNYDNPAVRRARASADQKTNHKKGGESR